MRVRDIEWEAERWKTQSSWERAWEKGNKVSCAAGTLGLALGLNTITILPWKLVKITKKLRKCFSPVSLYRPKQLDFVGTADTRSVQLIFFPIRNRGCTYTDALAGMIYTGRTSRYGTRLASLIHTIQSFFLLLYILNTKVLPDKLFNTTGGQSHDPPIQYNVITWTLWN